MIKIDGAFGVNLKNATDYLVEELITRKTRFI